MSEIKIPNFQINSKKINFHQNQINTFLKNKKNYHQYY